MPGEPDVHNRDNNVRFGAFVITLNRPHLLKRTLQLLLSQTRPPDHILVVDNGQSNETQSVVAAFSPALITYHAMSENVGPAGAAAYALDQLSRQGYEWIYWGDDDDPPSSSDTFERLLEVASSTGEDTGAVGAVGAMWDWAKGEIRRVPDESLTGIISVDLIAGNQQLILRREMVANVGLPDSRLFFGLEETEYCLRIRTAGYRLLVNGDMMREYRAKAGHLNWSPPRARLPRHSYDSIWRQYYSTRNHIFAMTRTFQRPQLARRELRKAVARTCCSWGRGPRYGLAFTKLQLRAIVDGYLGHMGRTVIPAPKGTTAQFSAAL
jgi:GT2 family glycosyltransferase